MPLYSPSTGALTPIGAYTFSGSEATYTFSSIPSGYSHLRLIMVARSQVVAASANVSLQINGDTGTNYNRERIQGAHSTLASVGSITSANIAFAAIPGSTAPAGDCGVAEVLIPMYAGTTFNKQIIAPGSNREGTTTAGQVATFTGGTWLNTAAITSLRVFESASSNFTAGSTVSLYGIS